MEGRRERRKEWVRGGGQEEGARKRGGGEDGSGGGSQEEFVVAYANAPNWGLHMQIYACKSWDLHMYLHISEVAAWLSCMVFAWYLHGICMVLHGFAWFCMVFAWCLHGSCMHIQAPCKYE